MPHGTGYSCRRGKPLNPDHPYNSPAYARSFDGSGVTIKNAAPWGGYFRLRGIDGTGHDDAVMLAPRIPFPDTDSCEEAVRNLRQWDTVSAACVPDPLYAPDREALSRIFDVTLPFKTHYICDLKKPVTLSDNHQRNIRYADKRCEIRPVDWKNNMGKWLELWNALLERHEIAGWSRFSQEHFEKLATVPGFTVHAAFGKETGEIVAISIWCEAADSVSAHLSVCGAAGYRLKANYALYAEALKIFSHKHFIDFGSNAGFTDNPEDGLSYFKNGFSNMTAQSFVCGVITDEARYKTLSASRPHDSYFPAYRAPLEKPSAHAG